MTKELLLVQLERLATKLGDPPAPRSVIEAAERELDERPVREEAVDYLVHFIDSAAVTELLEVVFRREFPRRPLLP